MKIKITIRQDSSNLAHSETHLVTEEGDLTNAVQSTVQSAIASGLAPFDWSMAVEEDRS